MGTPLARRISVGAVLLAALALPAPAAAQAVAFGAPSFYPVGSEPVSIAAGDVNGDSVLDLAVANSGSRFISVLPGAVGGGFGAASSVPLELASRGVALGDFNGDSKLDLASAGIGEPVVSVLLGDGAGGFGAQADFTVGIDPYEITVADFNHDTYQDMAIASANSPYVSILLGGSGGLSGPFAYFARGGATSIAVGRFNGDSHPDLVIVGDTGSVLLGDGNGGFGAPIDFNSGSNGVGVAAGDFNHDSFDDVAFADGGFLVVLLANGSGGFGSPIVYSAGAGTRPRDVAVGNFDTDPNQDLAVSDESTGDVHLFVGDGSGGFSGPTNFAAGANRQLAVGDFNADALPDLAAAHYCCPGSASVLLNTTNFFPHPQNAPSLAVALVPSFRQCGTGGNPANAVHAPPSLPGGPSPQPSCAPPAPTSSLVRVGAQSTGSAQLAVSAGDVRLVVGITDVTTPGGSPYDPTPGSAGADLTALVRVRITDTSNCSPSPCGSPFKAMGTASDLDFPSIPMDCEAGGPGTGSTCQANTSANALVPGAIVAGRRTILQAFRVRVLDSANEVFEQQGFLVP